MILDVHYSLTETQKLGSCMCLKVFCHIFADYLVQYVPRLTGNLTLCFLHGTH